MAGRQSARRRGRSNERFARIPLSVLESEAFTTLHHAAVRVLLILASQYWGGNNGALALTAQYARRFGFYGRDTIYRSLRELETRGLIVCTRRGMKIKNVFTLYALGWEEIDNRDGKPLEVSEHRNNLQWLQWRAPPVPEKTEIHTDRRGQSVPKAGNGERDSVPTSATSEAALVPTNGNTLRISPRSASERAANARASAARDVDSKIRKLLTKGPALTDTEIARILSVDVVDVRLVRDQHGYPNDL